MSRIQNTYTFGALSFDRDNKVITVAGKPVKLSDRQHKVLVILADSGKTLSQDEILAEMYGNRRDMPEPKMVDVLVCNIRKRIARHTPGSFIQTNWGNGYYIQKPKTLAA